MWCSGKSARNEVSFVAFSIVVAGFTQSWLSYDQFIDPYGKMAT